MKNKYHIVKNRCFLFIIASWLIARLEWAFEWSRLALFRSVPQKRIHFIIRNVKKPPVSHWSYENKHFSIINYDEANEMFIIYKLPHLNQN